MTDIVEALRAASKLPKSAIAVGLALNSAADEIERLRTALQTLVDANEGNLGDVDGALYEARKVLG